MTCPFAKFASLFPNTTKYDSPYHSSHPSSSSSSSLSEALRMGTAASHRAVEKSLGVSLLLQSLNPSSTSSTNAEGLRFERVDYVRFNLMLACIYVALEASLYTSREAELLRGLCADVGLIEALARSKVLLDDIEAHLNTIEVHTGASLAELAEVAKEENATTSCTATLPEDKEDPASRSKLLHLVQASLPTALLLNPTPNQTPALTEDHLALLTPAQTHATLAYVSTLLSLTRTDDAGLLLSHAYTRYLGDLSGGQHIVRKLSKRFPTETETSRGGFEFYTFSTRSSPTGGDLKSRFRIAMESTNPTRTTTSALVREANRAFDLNTAVFESLLPPELRMQSEPESSPLTNEKLESIRVEVKQNKSPATGHRWMMLGLACAGVLWTTHSLLLVKKALLVDGAIV